jgi:hypothetical protein
MMTWTQVYDPLGHWWLSTLVAALPIVVLLGLLAGLKVRPHWCAIAGATTAVLCAIFVFGTPSKLALVGITGKNVAVDVAVKEADGPTFHQALQQINQASKAWDQKYPDIH